MRQLPATVQGHDETAVVPDRCGDAGTVVSGGVGWVPLQEPGRRLGPSTPDGHGTPATGRISGPGPGNDEALAGTGEGIRADERDGDGFARLRFAYWAPIDADWRHEREHTPDLVESVRRLLEFMGNLRYDTGRLASARPAVDGPYSLRYDTGYGATLLIRTGDRTVLVLGDSDVADRVRTIVAAGAVHSWTLHPLPATSTPLRVLQAALGTRYYGLLSSSDYATVEEVNATPDTALLDLRGAGPKFITAVRTAIDDLNLGHLADLPITAPSPAEHSAARRQQLLDQLDPATALRNRDFLELLVRSSIPATGLTVIARALDAEPAPPADPYVIALLDTAGEIAVLGYYTRTRHTPRPAATQPRLSGDPTAER